ncbi:MAG: YdeI/OmpD-associated family protein [Saprospiraceae bacterium]|nr:YdeI/OmpD-associated family protein [Saprospiraceae bacterium]
MKSYMFDAVIIQREGMNAGYVEFPYDVQEEFGVRGRVPVEVTFDDVPYRGSLVKMGTDCHIIGLTREVREKVGKTFGDQVHVVLRQDTAPRVVEVPPVVKRHLARHPAARKVFEKLSYTHQREYVKWITEAKRDETRDRRLNKMIEMLAGGIKHP